MNGKMGQNKIIFLAAGTMFLHHGQFEAGLWECGCGRWGWLPQHIV
jgi:hypothetical protein